MKAFRRLEERRCDEIQFDPLSKLLQSKTFHAKHRPKPFFCKLQTTFSTTQWWRNIFVLTSNGKDVSKEKWGSSGNKDSNIYVKH